MPCINGAKARNVLIVMLDDLKVKASHSSSITGECPAFDGQFLTPPFIL